MNKKPKRYTKRVLLALTDEQHAKLVEGATRNKKSMSERLRYMIENWERLVKAAKQ